MPAAAASGGISTSSVNRTEFARKLAGSMVESSEQAVLTSDAIPFLY